MIMEGFFRKASTIVYHVRRKGRKRFKQILSHVQRIDLFINLPEPEVEKLTSCFMSQKFLKGSKLYYYNGPCIYLLMRQICFFHLWKALQRVLC